MQYADFARPYPFDMTPAKIHSGEHSQYMMDAQTHAYHWGRMLHIILGDHPTDTSGLDIGAYNDWVHKGGLQATLDGLHDAPEEVRLRAWNELNFHYLQGRMQFLWLPLANGGWTSEAERYDVLNKAQDFLAFDVLDHYAQRENLIAAAEGTHILFDPEIQAEHATITGMIQEYDAAIILMDVVRRHRNLTVIPAPLQFERTRKRTNVDFVVADFVGRRAVGVQVKSRLRQDDVEVADPDRVVFIDGDTDLGNIKVVRTQKNRSTERVTAWPGIVGVKRISNLKSYGAQSRHLWQGTRALPVMKQIADRLTRHLKVDHRELAGKIGERILAKL
jgi:hypothetical protein